MQQRLVDDCINVSIYQPTT